MASLIPTKMTPEQQDKLMAAMIENMISKDLGGNLGPFILGFAADILLLGIMLSQLITWYKYSSRTDGWFIRTIVIVGTVVSVASSCFVMVYIFHLFVYGYGKWLPIAQHRWALNCLITSLLVMAMVQTFYADRAYRLHHRKWIPIVAAMGITLPVATALAIRIRTELLTGSGARNIIDAIKSEIYVYTASILAIDIFLMVTILYGLWKIRSDWARTQALVSRMIKVSFEAQIPPTAVAFAVAVVFTVRPTSTWLYGFILCHTKIYMTGLFGALNARIELRLANSPNNTEATNSTGPSSSYVKQGGGVVMLSSVSGSSTELHNLKPLPMPPALRQSHGLSDYRRMDDMEWQSVENLSHQRSTPQETVHSMS